MTKLYNKAISVLQYASDLHLEKGFNRYIKPSKPYLLLGGDIGYPSQSSYGEFLLNTSSDFDKIFVIAGNHEYDLFDQSYTDQLIKNICLKRNNIYFLQKNTHVLCEKNGIFIAGCTLWSKLPKSKYERHLEHVKWIKQTLENNLNNNYIIATHHAPLFASLNEISHISNYFASNQSDIIQIKNMLCWIHGHTHINKNINVYDKWILSNQYGSFEKSSRHYK